MWIMGKLMQQDALRIEMREAILSEMRQRHHTIMSGMDMRQAMLTEALEEVKDKIGGVDNRMVRVETILNGHLTRRP